VLYCKYHEQRTEEPLEGTDLQLVIYPQLTLPLLGLEKPSNARTDLSLPNTHKAWPTRNTRDEQTVGEGEEVALTITEDDSDGDQ
jgi:hypothetical protein